jgi:hypothetical protein
MQKLQYLTGALADKNDGVLIQSAIRGIYDRMSSQAFNSSALAQGAATTTMATTAIVHGLAGGVPITKAVSGDFWGPSTGVTAGFKVLAGTTNVFCMYIDAAGVASGAFGTAATTVSTTGLNGVKFPPMPEKKMMVGFVIISGGSGDWTAGTSTFTTATTVTFCTIVNTVGMFDPTATI